MGPREKVSRLLRRHGWNRPELARRAGVHCRNLGHWLAGTKPQPRHREGAARVAELLGVPPRWLWSCADWEQQFPAAAVDEVVKNSGGNLEQLYAEFLEFKAFVAARGHTLNGSKSGNSAAKKRTNVGKDANDVTGSEN